MHAYFDGLSDGNPLKIWLSDGFSDEILNKIHQENDRKFHAWKNCWGRQKSRQKWLFLSRIPLKIANLVENFVKKLVRSVETDELVKIAHVFVVLATNYFFTPTKKNPDKKVGHFHNSNSD